MRTFLGDVQEHHGHGLEAQPTRGHQPLVPADHGAVLPPGDDRVHQAELLDAPRQRLQLGVGDRSWIVWVWPERRDLDVLDFQNVAGRL